MAIAALIIIWLRHRYGRYEALFQVGWGLLFGGALGNTLDRLIYGYVTDMFHTPPGHGIFNLADISLQLGTVLLIVYAVIQPRKGR